MILTKMAALKRIGKLSKQLFMKSTPVSCVTRNYVIDIHKDPGGSILEDLVLEQKDEFPGPYPETEEERIKAALKYNLHPSDYKPLPKGWNYSGDYPDVPWISVEAKDPYYPWDYPYIRKNFGEPLHKEYDMLGEDRYDFGVRQLVDDRKASAIFWAIFGGMMLLGYSLPDTSQPYMDKQYPADGVHYTFELVK